MKDVKVTVVGARRIGRRLPGVENVISCGSVSRGDEIMALAIISAFRENDVRLCTMTSDQFNRARNDSSFWKLAYGGYDFSNRLYGSSGSRASEVGMAGLLWKDYGEEICSHYCSWKEGKAGTPQLVAEAVSRILIEDIDKAAIKYIAQHDLEPATVYSMLGFAFYRARKGADANWDKYIREAFGSARALLLDAIDAALQGVRASAAKIA